MKLLGINENFDRQNWRLLITPPASGAWNMAVDEALLQHVNEHRSTAILRFYAWEPACLSLGYAQSASDADLGSLQRNGWSLVRRPTGGRAILHTDELTYSVVAGHSEPRLQGSILESYRRIAAALLNGLHILGINAESSALAQVPANSDPKGPVCFEVPSNYEITWQGKKLIGSAQARRKEGVLQHGSFPLCGDLTRITQALHFIDENKRKDAAQRLGTRAATAAECLGQALSWEDASRAFIQAFSDTLNLNLEPGELTDSEAHSAQSLVRNKFAADDWTFRI